MVWWGIVMSVATIAASMVTKPTDEQQQQQEALRAIKTNSSSSTTLAENRIFLAGLVCGVGLHLVWNTWVVRTWRIPQRLSVAFYQALWASQLVRRRPNNSKNNNDATMLQGTLNCHPQPLLLKNNKTLSSLVWYRRLWLVGQQQKEQDELQPLPQDSTTNTTTTKITPQQPRVRWLVVPGQSAATASLHVSLVELPPQHALAFTKTSAVEMYTCLAGQGRVTTTTTTKSTTNSTTTKSTTNSTTTNLFSQGSGICIDAGTVRQIACTGNSSSQSLILLRVTDGGTVYQNPRHAVNRVERLAANSNNNNHNNNHHTNSWTTRAARHFFGDSLFAVSTTASNTAAWRDEWSAWRRLFGF